VIDVIFKITIYVGVGIGKIALFVVGIIKIKD